MALTKKEKDCLNYVQSKFYPNLAELTSNFKRPAQKFIKQMVYGIIKSKCAIVNRVAKEQKESISVKKTCDRLYRNLKRKFLHSGIMDNLLFKNLQRIAKHSPIFIDISDINKNSANKMEGLARVWDGSKNEINKGYFTLQATSCDVSDQNRYRLLYSELFSIKAENTSENEKIINLLRKITIGSQNRGIIVGDRGLDRIRLLNFLLENNIAFILRGDERHLLYKGKSRSYYEIAEDIELNHEVISKGKKFKAGSVKVGIKLPNPPSRKHQRKRIKYFNFVVAKEVLNKQEKKSKQRGYIYYLVNLKGDYSKEKILEMTVRYYGMRWSIEDAHREIKQDLKWEKMQLLTYESLKNMNALVWLAASFIYNKVGRMTLYLVKKIPHRMLYRNKAKELAKNLQYRLTDVVSYLFGFFNLNPRKKYAGIFQKYNKKCQQLTMESIL